MTTALCIIRQSSYTATPWRNGGGTTHEAIRVPAGGDFFRWRVSVANIEVSGPFSDFAGYRRTMVLLRGTGLTLKFANGEQRVLETIGDMANFDGAVSTFCELHDGPCVDLNFMVSNEARAEVRVLDVDDDSSVQVRDEKSTLILSIADPMMLRTDAGETVKLEPWDLAVLSRGSARIGTLKDAAASASRAVVFATISS